MLTKNVSSAPVAQLKPIRASPRFSLCHRTNAALFKQSLLGTLRVASVRNSWEKEKKKIAWFRDFFLPQLLKTGRRIQLQPRISELEPSSGLERQESCSSHWLTQICVSLTG